MILQVGADADDGVAAGLQHRVVGRADVPEGARVEDDLDALVRRREGAQMVLRAVGGGVIDNDNFNGFAAGCGFAKDRLETSR